MTTVYKGYTITQTQALRNEPDWWFTAHPEASRYVTAYQISGYSGMWFSTLQKAEDYINQHLTSTVPSTPAPTTPPTSGANSPKPSPTNIPAVIGTVVVLGVACVVGYLLLKS